MQQIPDEEEGIEVQRVTEIIQVSLTSFIHSFFLFVVSYFNH